jgi:hypothetical protein
MPEFRVELGASADVCTAIYVDAESSEEAREKATNIAEGGDAVWVYRGVQDETIECTGVCKV